jgi:3-deoxy-D-manno-octulosonic acid hydroxylase-like protein
MLATEANMGALVDIAIDNWDAAGMSDSDREQALCDLESGKVLFFPRLDCPLERIRPFLLADSTASHRKNVSFDASTGRLRASGLSAALDADLRRAMSDYASRSGNLLRRLFPHYGDALAAGRTSFRPVEIATRKTSWRKDDTRLHVDSFPATPVQGKRILRIFSNLNPDGQLRAWRIGEPFEKVAGRFLQRIAAPLPGTSTLLRLLGITKTRRSLYDHYMLGLHDAMKADVRYQAEVQQTPFDFPAGTTWLVYTDQVSHAAMAGRCAFEQTFYLDVAAMADETKSPLRTLERLLHRPLV